MKWLFAEAPVVIVSRNIPFIILFHLIRFKQMSRNGQKNFQAEPLATSSLLYCRRTLCVRLNMANFLRMSPMPYPP